MAFRVQGGEIVTVQMGRVSNFTGTHFWNLQRAQLMKHSSDEEQEIDFYPLYQLREICNEEVYAPRLLSYDLRGSMGSYKQSVYYQSNVAESGVDASSLWGGKIETHEVASHPKNEFLKAVDSSRSKANPTVLERKNYNLEESVKYWSDFNESIIHQRSIYELKGFDEGIHPFSSFHEGNTVLQNLNSNEAEDIRDQIRVLLEDCDRLQGFQMFVDVETGFSTFGSDYVKLLRDEFISSKNEIVLFALSSPSEKRSPSSDSYEQHYLKQKYSSNCMLNSAIALSQLYETVSLYVPITPTDEQISTFEGLRPNPNMLYHTSAIYASAIDNISLPWRLGTTSGLSSFIGRLLQVNNQAKVALLSHSLPLPLYAKSNTTLSRNHLMELMPKVNSKKETPMSEITIIRGATSVITEVPPSLRSQNSSSYVIKTPLELSVSYPTQIFVNNLNSEGIIYPKTEPQTAPVQAVPTLGNIQITPALCQPLADLSKAVLSLTPELYGLQKDELKSIHESLYDISDVYS